MVSVHSVTAVSGQFLMLELKKLLPKLRYAYKKNNRQCVYNFFSCRRYKGMYFKRVKRQLLHSTNALHKNI